MVGTTASATNTVRDVQYPVIDRLATITVVAVPAVMLVLGVVFSWGGVLHPADMLILALTYTITVVGIGVGFHRLFTHRSFKTRPWVRAALAIGDSATKLAIPTFGEAWHNNHHAFPTSARHGLGRHQLDPSARLISLLERAGLAWDVVRISPERMAERLRPPSRGRPGDLAAASPDRGASAPSRFRRGARIARRSRRGSSRRRTRA